MLLLVSAGSFKGYPAQHNNPVWGPLQQEVACAPVVVCVVMLNLTSGPNRNSIIPQALPTCELLLQLPCS